MWQPIITEYTDGNIFDTVHADIHRGLQDDKSQFWRKKEPMFFEDEYVNDFCWEAVDAALEKGTLREGVESCSIELRCHRGDKPVIIGTAGKYGDVETSYARVCFGRVNNDEYRITSLYPIAEYQVNTERLASIDLNAINNTIDTEKGRWGKPLDAEKKEEITM